jgi:hypothetical protein
MHVVMAAVVVACWVDWLMLLSWNRWYFTTGVPIFRREVAARGPIPSPEELEAAFEHGFVIPLAFNRFEHDCTGFRDRLFDMSFRFRSNSFGLAHGVITYDENQQTLTVRAYANWSILAFDAVAISYAVLHPQSAWIGLVGLAVIHGISYGVQRYQLRKLITFLESRPEPDGSP